MAAAGIKEARTVLFSKVNMNRRYVGNPYLFIFGDAFGVLHFTNIMKFFCTYFRAIFLFN